MRVRVPPRPPNNVERSLTVEPLAVNQEDVGSVPIVQPKFNAEVAQLVGGNGLRSRTVRVRIPPSAPFQKR